MKNVVMSMAPRELALVIPWGNGSLHVTVEIIGDDATRPLSPREIEATRALLSQVSSIYQLIERGQS